MTTLKTSTKAAPVHYLVEPLDLHAHLFRITLTIAQPAMTQHVSLPVWIPGSYLVREFAKNLQNLTASQGKKSLEPVQSDKSSWQIDCNPDQPLRIVYLVFAHDNSVRTAWLDSTRGFFNGTSLCLRVEGQEDAVHTLELKAPAGKRDWQVATGATPHKVSAAGFGSYTFADYDTLVDCPFGAVTSTCAVSSTSLSLPVRPPPLTVHACWPTPGRFARPRWRFGMATQKQPNQATRKPPRKSRRSKTMSSCSMRWTTAMAGWSTAIRQR
jgi:hypothetical protein